MAAEQEAALRMIQAIETALNPSTAQQQRIEAYEVEIYKRIFFSRTRKYLFDKEKVEFVCRLL